ncbi:MAG TPA: pyridoxine 5'-phosphate synthase, partial [Spirochaetota bacterium]|nr:pyridoxine 5'-phosphate synthase [Spirochaetota bacterium]
LNYTNVRDVLRTPGLEELNIGHSIIAQSVFTGLATAVRDMAILVEESNA